MREAHQESIIESKLEIIERLSKIPKPAWIIEESREIHKSYEDLRENILINRCTWNYFEYTHRFCVHYYNIALLLYSYYQQHKTNLDIIRISVDKCVSKLQGIRSSEKEIAVTEDLFSKVNVFKSAIDKIYTSLDSKLSTVTSNNNRDRLIKAKILLHLGQVEYQNFNFFLEDLSSLRSNLLGMLLLNFISDVEELLTLHVTKDHFSKSNMCLNLGRAYQICGQQNLYVEFKKISSRQIILAFQGLGSEDNSSGVRAKIRKILKEEVLQKQRELVDIYKTIKEEYPIELSNLECAYVERKFKKYCIQCFTEDIHKVLVKIAASNNKKIFMRLLSNLEAVNTLAHLPDYFTTKSSYLLLIAHQGLLKPDEIKFCIQTYKKDIYNTISPKISEAQNELDVLKQLVVYLRSVPDCRSVISNLKLNKLCMKTLPVQTFFQNILELEEHNNEELIHLKTLIDELTYRNKLFFMDKFVDILEGYLFLPDAKIEEDIMTISGRLIIMSEVMEMIKEKKNEAIKELRITGADIVFVNENLENDIWAGVNVLVVAKTIHIQGYPIWNISGRHAEHYSSQADDGVNPGDDGKTGKNGQIGNSGGNVYLSCTNMINSENLTIISNGGNGGNGQSGGNGAKGIDGHGIKTSDFENMVNPSEPKYRLTKQIARFSTAVNLARMIAPALEERNRMIAPALEERNRMIAPALEERIRMIAPALEERNRMIARPQEERNLPNWPLPKIAKKVKLFDITWSTSQFRLNFLDTPPCYFTGSSEDDCILTYNYYPHWLPGNQEVLILYEGTPATIGGRGGKGGLEGPGGFPGEIDIKCGHPVNVTMEKNAGAVGRKGLDGHTGYPGKNGWDMGLVFVNGLFSKTWKIKGKYQDCKLTMTYHSSRKDCDFVYSPYRHKELGYEDYYIEIREKSSNINVYDRNANRRQTKQIKEKWNNAVRTKAISKSVISELEDEISNDIVDELINIALGLEDFKEQALEEIVEKDEEKETETTNFQVQRQAVFDDSALGKERKILRKRRKIIKMEPKNLDVENLIGNSLNLNLWTGLKNVVVDLPDLNRLFSILLSKKLELKNSFSQIYNLLLSKYKIAICQEIEKNDKLPDVQVYFTLNPIENYLISGTNPNEYTHDELGIVQEYFVPDPQPLLKKLQNYLQNVDVGQILYPLKFFILEKSYKNPEFKEKSTMVLEKLNNLETRLETLIKIYIYAHEQDDTSSMLNAIEQRKNEIIKTFKTGTDYEFVRSEFVEYIGNIGMTSTAVRELLACAFQVNIQIYIMDKDGQSVKYHDHNPTSKDTVYFFLINDLFVEFRLDNQYFDLVESRKKLSKNYSDILECVSEFVCKKDFDEFYKNFDSFNGFESTEKKYIHYKNVSEDEVIRSICSFFPLTDLQQIYPIIRKLTFIQNKNILLAILQRFEIEGNHITTYEMIFVISSILKSFVDKTTNLELFEWILSIKPQSIWLNHIFYIELENHFKKSLKSTSILKYLNTVKQKDIILLMNIKLQESTDDVSLKCITTCMEVLSQIEVDEETIRNLPLSKWQYTLREQYLEHTLNGIVKWKNNEQLQKALYYLNCVESNIGRQLVDKLLAILKKKKDTSISDIYLDILSLLHLQECSLDNKLLEKIEQYGIASIREELFLAQNEDRSLEILLKLINNNSHTSNKIKNALNEFRNDPFLRLNINMQYSVREIKSWTAKFKKGINGLQKKDKETFITDYTNDILRKILHAIKLRKGILLRTSQRLAILLMLNHNYNTLSQISTGEGKSLIVVAVSIFKALCGEKIDIITSSSVLAIRDATIHKDIFDLFNISVSHNCSEKIDERRDAYSASPVIFGDLSNFQRDYLLDRFYGKNILGDRTFDTLIVDEVDSMLLDKGNNTLYLSHEIPGMDKLESVYQFLWKRISMSAGRKIENFEETLKKNVLFDLYGTISIEDLEVLLAISKSDANFIYNFLKDIKVIIPNNIVAKNISNDDSNKLPIKYKPLIHKLRYILNKILKRDREIRIPRCLYNFVELHINIWIQNGLLAIIMEEGIDYVVDVDRTQTKADINPNITIIDKGTGTDQSNSQWEEALHQFLQLKHGCKISSQSLKAVFISNVSYFKKYNKLFGLTGTLGSQVERDLLKELYQVQFVNIPTAKPKKFMELEPILCCTETDWQFRIVNRTKELIQSNRSVLIICETIKEVNSLSKAFQHSDISNKKIYKREYEDCLLAQGKEKLEGGNVIIATNLAGRGTDIKITDSLNKNGGLHVLLTYLPSNARIELQAFGRAARSGQNGSGQLITIGHGSFLDKREQRELLERERIAEIKIFFDTRIKIEENFFEFFTEVYKRCNEKLIKEKRIKEIASQRLLDRWAFWLDEYGSKLMDPSIDRVFDAFKADIKDNFINWDNWTNDPIQLVKIGLHYINKKSYEKSIQAFEKVIKTEPLFSEAAHYYKAAAVVMLLDFEKQPFTGKNLERFNEFKYELKKAELLFEAHKDACITSSAFVQNLKQSTRNSFVTIEAYKTQQETMINLYDFYIRSIKDILGHSVMKSSFISQEIKQSQSEDLYDSFLKNSVLKQAYVVEATKEDIEELSNNFGISPDVLLRFLQSYKNKTIEEQTFLADLKIKVKIPNLVEFWDTLVKEQKLINELKLVIIEKGNLTRKQEDAMKSIEEVDVNMKSSNKKYVFMKQFLNCANEDLFIFEENKFRSEINRNVYETLKEDNILTFNRRAKLCHYNINTPIALYDSINIENLMADKIVQQEAQEILNILSSKNFLTKNSLNTYSLSQKYDETKIPSIPSYDQALYQILRINFAYRIAVQNIENELQNEDGLVYVKIISDPHVSLMWELIAKKIIQPVKVDNHLSDEINNILQSYGKNSEEKTSIKNYVKGVLKQLVGGLISLDTPSFGLVPITECMEDIQVSPLQELNTFITNSLDFILKSDEKKYTREMIWSTIFVTVLGPIELVAGLALQLFSAGILSHFGNWLISECLGDLEYAISSWCTGQFSWDDYGRYKLRSMALSFVLAAMSAGFAKGLFSKFGKNLAMSGVIGQTGKEVTKMVGRELITEVGERAVLKEFGKQFVVKVGEGLARGLINEGVNQVLQSYLQNLCNQLSSMLVRDIEKAVQAHSIGLTLLECYRMFDKKEAKEKILHHTEKSFRQPSVNTCIIMKIAELTSSISNICSDAAKFGTKAEYVAYVDKFLQCSVYASHIFDIIASVKRMLDKVDQEIKKDIKEANNRGVKEKQYTNEEIHDFKTEVINQWSTILQENANTIFSEKLVRPILHNCTKLIVRQGKAGAKHLFNYTRNTYHRHIYESTKEKKNSLLENQSLSDETEKQIMKSYYDTLISLKKQVRDPKLYAEIVLEKGYMDAICIKASTSVIHRLKGTDHRPVKISIKTDSGSIVEYTTPGSGEWREINVSLTNHHFSSSTVVNHSTEYDRLYHAVSQEFPELTDLSVDKFRELISKEITSNPEIKDDIKNGKHAFTIRKNIYGGYTQCKIATDELRKGLMEGKYMFSQSSVSERTSDRPGQPSVHLADLQNNLRDNFDETKPINTVVLNSGNLIFLDNRRVVTAATINNPDVKIMVRLFRYDEVLPIDLQAQYSTKNFEVKTAGFAAKVRIQRTSSFDGTKPRTMGYLPQEVRIRLSPVDRSSNNEQKVEFFRRTREIGFIKYKRGGVWTETDEGDRRIKN